MKIELDDNLSYHRIRGYAPGQVTVDEHCYTASLIVSPGQIIAEWPPEHFSELRAEHFELIAALKPEIVLLGTGQELCFPPAIIVSPLIQRGIGYEIMDTGGACRTYNILAAEGRRVVVALLMIQGYQNKESTE
jgi:uncharacterized protein